MGQVAAMSASVLAGVGRAPQNPRAGGLLLKSPPTLDALDVVAGEEDGGAATLRTITIIWSQILSLTWRRGNTNAREAQETKAKALA